MAEICDTANKKQLVNSLHSLFLLLSINISTYIYVRASAFIGKNISNYITTVQPNTTIHLKVQNILRMNYGTKVEWDNDMYRYCTVLVYISL